MFTYKNKVRFSEVDTDGYLGIKGILNYFQDCSELQSETLHNSFDDVHKDHHAWILNSWQIQIHKKPYLGDIMYSGTAPHKMKAFEGHRNFFILDENKEVMVNANSIWTFLDTDTMRPCKITEDQLSKYVLDEPYDMEYAPRKIDIRSIEESAYTKVGEINVVNYMLDMNKHMNNAQYVICAVEYLPEGYDYNQIRVDYRKAAYYGDKLIVANAVLEDRLVQTLSDEEGTVYNIIEYSKF